MRKFNKGMAYLLIVCLCAVSISFPVSAQEPGTATVPSAQSSEPGQSSGEVQSAEPGTVRPSEPGQLPEPVQPSEPVQPAQQPAGPVQPSEPEDPAGQDNHTDGNTKADEDQSSHDVEKDTGTAGNDDPGKGRLTGDIPEEFFGAASFGARASGIQHDSRFSSGYTIQDGIDVSEWNGTINWTKVKQAGIQFAFIRVAWRGYGGGTLNVDNTAYTNLKGAIAAGIPVGVYVFSQAISTAEAKEEADYLIDKIKGYNVTLPIIMDFEFASENGQHTGRLYDKFKNQNKTAATNVCMAFCQEVVSRGYTPMVYGNPDMFTHYLNPGTISASYQIWLAHYTTKTDYAGAYNYWQYSSTGRVNGISGNVDMNVRYVKDGGDVPAVPPVDSLEQPVLSSASNSNGAVTIKWKEIANAAGYHIYRKTAGSADSSWTKIASVQPGNTVQYKDTTAVSGTEYIYTVSGYNGSVESTYDEAGVGCLYLKTPALISAQGSSSDVKVTWEKIPEADGYTIHRKEKETGGSWTQIGKVDNNSTVTYSDTTGVTGTLYAYTVRAYKGTTRSGYVGSGISGKKASYENYQTTDQVNYRNGAGTSYAVKGTLAKGKKISVEKGYSHSANGYTWYRFLMNSNTYYIASAYLKKVDISTTSPKPIVTTKPAVTPTYVKYQTKAKVNYRSGAGTSYAVKGTLAKGKTINIEKGYSKKKNGYTWYRFKKGTKTYYIASKYVKKAGKTYVKYKTKTKVNYRSGAGTSYKTKGTLKKGTKINVEKGYSKKKNGYTWYRFKKGSKNYYIVSKYLKKVS
ncbi:MAG: hypothetical protein HFG97_14460 [Dorea sp.]|nr:hypothetical protein [Dorea sp.]